MELHANVDLRTIQNEERSFVVTEREQALIALGFTQNCIDTIRANVCNTLWKSAEVRKKIEDLKALGFADPVKMITSQPAILGYTIENIQRKIEDLKALGFADPVKMITSLPAILSYAIENVQGKIEALKALGFAVPVKMITSQPAILGLTIENIQRKIEDLKALGFAVPLKMITSLPAILSYAIENIQGKIEALKALGFADPVKMITSQPAILSYAIESVQRKIEALKTLGFTVPVKMITSLPAILGYTIENIQRKIEDLKALGFADPVKMITSLPTILGYTIENITGKMQLIEKTSAYFDVSLCAQEIIENNLSILGAKIDKLWTITRIFAEHNHCPSPTEINSFLFANLERIVLAYGENPSASISEIIRLEKLLKKEGTLKDDLRSKIAILLDKNPKNKVLSRYARGYPLQKLAS